MVTVEVRDGLGAVAELVAQLLDEDANPVRVAAVDLGPEACGQGVERDDAPASDARATASPRP